MKARQVVAIVINRRATCDYYNRSKSSIYNQKNATDTNAGSIFC
nr:MAG TPA: hypothetical protein [Caudoviricetes sp.]